jgi:hypothetical protein
MRYLSFLFLLLSGCSYHSAPSLSVRTIYSSAERLSSVKEDTPDPLKPLLGKSYCLLVHWSSSSAPSPILNCYYHFEDATVIEEQQQLNGTSGQINLEVDRALIRLHGSVNSYKIALSSQGKEVASSQHKLWVPVINISE